MPVSLAPDSPQTPDAELPSAVQAPLLSQSSLHAQPSSFRPPALKSLVIHETFTETAISSPQCVQPQVCYLTQHPASSIDPCPCHLLLGRGLLHKCLERLMNVPTTYTVLEG